MLAPGVNILVRELQRPAWVSVPESHRTVTVRALDWHVDRTLVTHVDWAGPDPPPAILAEQKPYFIAHDMTSAFLTASVTSSISSLPGPPGSGSRGWIPSCLVL